MAKQQRDDHVLVQFGVRVRAERVRLGISQEALAERAGLDRTYVSGVERGRRNVALVNITRLASALGVDPASLVEGLAVDPDQTAPT